MEGVICMMEIRYDNEFRAAIGPLPQYNLLLYI